MSSTTSPTVAQILAGLGVSTFSGEVVIGAAGAISTLVNVTATVQNLVVVDTGATGDSTATATLTTQNGPLAVASGVEGTIVTSNGGKQIVFSGTVDDINADLKLLSYVSSSAGNDTISLTFTDSAGNTKSASIPVSVLPSPQITGSPTKGVYVVATSTGQNATLSGGNQIYVADNASDTVTASNTPTSVTGGAAGSSLTLVQDGGSYNLSDEAGSTTLVANSAPGTIHGGVAGSTLVAFLEGQPTTYIGGMGNDELVGGSGNMTVDGGAGGTLTVFGGSGTLQYVGGHNDRETVVGGTGAETIHAAASGGDYFGGAGGSQMFATGAGTFMIGDVNGDIMTASAFGGDGMVAGSGNETLNGGGSRWENVVFGGSGQDMVMLGQGADTFVGGAGAATIQMGSGSADLFAGAGAMLMEFDSSHTGSSNGPGSDYVGGFRVGTDHLRLSGGLTVTSYTSAGGATSIKLSDGTQIHLAGVSGANEAKLFG